MPARMATAAPRRVAAGAFQPLAAAVDGRRQPRWVGRQQPQVAARLRLFQRLQQCVERTPVDRIGRITITTCAPPSCGVRVSFSESARICSITSSARGLPVFALIS
jgi:hypothetical protein